MSERLSVEVLPRLASRAFDEVVVVEEPRSDRRITLYRREVWTYCADVPGNSSQAWHRRWDAGAGLEHDMLGRKSRGMFLQIVQNDCLRSVSRGCLHSVSSR